LKGKRPPSTENRAIVIGRIHPSTLFSGHDATEKLPRFSRPNARKKFIRNSFLAKL
jgi:hypothetical protein